MGFNTVVLILNDYLHSLKDSPHAVTWAITHPPHNREIDVTSWRETIAKVALEHNEPIPPYSALKVLPSFHMDYCHLLAVGHNSIEQTSGMEFQKDKKVTTKLPSWFPHPEDTKEAK